MIKTNRRELLNAIPRVKTARPDFKIEGHGMTDVGCRREANEDSFLMLPRNDVYIVADGMGGHAGGQVASKITIETAGFAFIRRITEAETAAKANGHTVEVTSVVEASVREACARVYDTARAEPGLNGMGSTCTAMMVYGGHAFFGQVGDSRAYLLRDGELIQVTEDHSLVQEQVSAGLITPEQAKISPMRNIITRSIGFEREVKVDVGAVPLKVGDQFMLCSDGLTGHVDDHEIREIMLEHPRRKAARVLIALANSRGGDDNSTVIIVTVMGLAGRPGSRGKRARRNRA